MSNAPAADAAELKRREKGDLAIQARAILRKHCAECHGDVPIRGSVSVLDHKQLISTTPPVPFVNPKDPGHSQLLEFVKDGSMPPGGRNRPTPPEIEILERWVGEAKAASYPKAFDDETTLKVMLDDWTGRPDAEKPYLRYLSLGHLVPDDPSSLKLAAEERKLQLALLAASGKQTDPPFPVDDTATLFRLDIRTLGWDTRDLFDRVVKGSANAHVYPIIPFDLILLEYPFRHTPPANAAKLQQFFTDTKQHRPVPFLRADWVSESLASGTPLAADLESLVMLAEARAKNAKEMPCGPPARPFASAKGAKPPLTAWYGRDADPDPFGLQFDAVDPGRKSLTEIRVDEPFMLQASAKREVRFTLLNVLAIGDVRFQAVTGGDIVKPDAARLMRPDTGKPFSFSGLLTRQEETEHFVLLAAETEAELPKLTIIRSRHSDGPECREKNLYPVWRFVFDREPDPAKVVRKVLPIKVKP